MTPPQRPARAAPSADAISTAEADPVAFQVLNEIGIINQLSQHRADRLLGPGLNMSQFVVLNHFTRLGGPRSMVQLASAMQVTKGAMSNTVARLAAKGLVAVQPDPADGRGKQVDLTDAGRAARLQAVANLGQGLSGLNRDIPPEALQAALPLLRQLRAWFDSHR